MRMELRNGNIPLQDSCKELQKCQNTTPENSFLSSATRGYEQSWGSRHRCSDPGTPGEFPWLYVRNLLSHLSHPEHHPHVIFPKQPLPVSAITCISLA